MPPAPDPTRSGHAGARRPRGWRRRRSRGRCCTARAASSPPPPRWPRRPRCRLAGACASRPGRRADATSRRCCGRRPASASTHSPRSSRIGVRSFDDDSGCTLLTPALRRRRLPQASVVVEGSLALLADRRQRDDDDAQRRGDQKAGPRMAGRRNRSMALATRPGRAAGCLRASARARVRAATARSRSRACGTHGRGRRTARQGRGRRCGWQARRRRCSRRARWPGRERGTAPPRAGPTCRPPGSSRPRSTTLPSPIETSSPQKISGRASTPLGPGVPPTRTIAPSSNAITAFGAIPSASVGMKAVCALALLAASGPAMPWTAPRPKATRGALAARLSIA